MVVVVAVIKVTGGKIKKKSNDLFETNGGRLRKEEIEGLISKVESNSEEEDTRENCSLIFNLN